MVLPAFGESLIFRVDRELSPVRWDTHPPSHIGDMILIDANGMNLLEFYRKENPSI